jgi:tetraacyldisaccharide 4'-kinase
VIITKSPENITPIDKRIIHKNLSLAYYQNLFFTSVKPEEIKSVFPGYSSPAASQLRDKKSSVLLVGGIAQPEGLKKMALRISDKITELYFPDHHAFDITDLARIQDEFNRMPGNNKVILTSEKDAVRLRVFNDLPEEIKKNMFFIPIKVVFNNDEGRNFNNIILSYVKINKRNSFLHQESLRYTT